MVDLKKNVVTKPQSLPESGYTSGLLESLGMTDLLTETVCARCPSAYWHVTTAGNLRLYCKSLSAVMDTLIVDCDAYRQIVTEMQNSETEA